MNIKQRIRLNDLDPRDPDHDDLEDLREEWVQRYIDEYAEYGTMAGEESTDLGLDTQLGELRDKAVAIMVCDAATTADRASAWMDYGRRLKHLITEAADETVSDNWEEIKREALERHNDF